MEKTTLLTAAQVAERLGLTRATVYQLSYKDLLPGRVKLGARVRWREADIDGVVANGLPARRADLATATGRLSNGRRT
jgi:predicted DNA-binding transcriptional regulator AlpA